MIETRGLLTDAEAAAYLKIKKQTLACWRCTRRHDLRFIKVGRCIRYRLSDIDDWLKSREIGADDHGD